ncbi:hypothetical protein [Paractinoplanes toevensis]|uniref:Uncharacterized protein n=1 Tax=Paractinoplanes toevensis TaxID=571911 RepID=A0A919TFE3_9ACTN|nr:hypothetical protein [Actinoplanes toevensis]GIM94342.1 hypothetical protein Ato02nite_061350 [Actinoplanes toevensis]
MTDQARSGEGTWHSALTGIARNLSPNGKVELGLEIANDRRPAESEGDSSALGATIVFAEGGLRKAAANDSGCVVGDRRRPVLRPVEVSLGLSICAPQAFDLRRPDFRFAGMIMVVTSADLDRSIPWEDDYLRGALHH